MKSDRLLIVIRGRDEETPRISALLSTIVDMPPVVPFDTLILGEQDQSHRLAEFCGQCSHIEFIERAGDLGRDIDGIVKTSRCNLQMVLHPDVLFTNKHWCEVIFSKMIDAGASMLGAMPFIMRRINGADIPFFAPWFIAYDRDQIIKAGGFSSDCGEASWIAAYLRAKKLSMYCVGAEISSMVVHTERSWLDIHTDESRAREEQSLDILVRKENLL